MAEVHDTDSVLFHQLTNNPDIPGQESLLDDVLMLANRSLNANELETFRDYFLNDYTMEQTASLEHETSATIRGRIFRIRQKLRRHLS